MAEVVIVKFKKGCRPYYFKRGKFDLQKGQGVVVETARGLEYAIVVNPLAEVPEEAIVSPLKPVIRPATPKDEAVVKHNEERRPEALALCKQKIQARNLEMKLIDCEFSFDGTKVVFYFSADGRVDFRELVKDLAMAFHLRIELRQVGIRDETKILGGVAPCGRACCCASCMPEFQKVSIKMAKNQGLSLNPGKISGLCGRLMCCLSYENDYYADAYKKMPKLGGTVGTPEGTGTVVSVNMLKMEVRVKIEKDGALLYRDFPVDKLTFKKSTKEETEKDEDEKNLSELE
jgi:cell fate regulator YaaT (PSP1 superfamily)